MLEEFFGGDLSAPGLSAGDRIKHRETSRNYPYGVEYLADPLIRRYGPGESPADSWADLPFDRSPAPYLGPDALEDLIVPEVSRLHRSPEERLAEALSGSISGPQHIPMSHRRTRPNVPLSATNVEALSRLSPADLDRISLSRASGGIIGLAGGGYVPMYASGGVPGYGIGGFLKGLGKFALKAAPMALSFIPGVSGLSGLAKAGIGALAQTGSDFASGKGFDLGSTFRGATRAHGMGEAVDRMRGIEGLEGE